MQEKKVKILFLLAVYSFTAIVDLETSSYVPSNTFLDTSDGSQVVTIIGTNDIHGYVFPIKLTRNDTK